MSRELVEAQRPIRVLRSVAWPQALMERFFSSGERELPRPEYKVDRRIYTAIQVLDELAARTDPRDPGEALLKRSAESFALAGRMLDAIGSKRLYAISRELYGAPNDQTRDPRVTNKDLALHILDLASGYRDKDLGGPPPAVLPAEEVARELRHRFRRFFGDDAPRVSVVGALSARAVAGSAQVRLRGRTGFSEAELIRLEHHEGYVHVATTLNGKRQPILDALGLLSPRAVRVQEGLAVFAELMAQALDLERLKTIAARVVGIHMAAEGADFLELYRFFREHTETREEAFDATRRVVRGGLVTGGAPLTKDLCYLDGLFTVYSFLRAAIVRRRPELVRLLFVGKVDTSDLPELVALAEEGLLELPRFSPSWGKDLRFLAAQMGLSALMTQTDASAWMRYCDELMERVSSPERSEVDA